MGPRKGLDLFQNKGPLSHDENRTRLVGPLFHISVNIPSEIDYTGITRNIGLGKIKMCLQELRR